MLSENASPNAGSGRVADITTPICRLCPTTSRLTRLDSVAMNRHEPMMDRILAITTIQACDYNYICSNCIVKVRRAYAFRSQCLKYEKTKKSKTDHTSRSRKRCISPNASTMSNSKRKKNADSLDCQLSNKLLPCVIVERLNLDSLASMPFIEDITPDSVLDDIIETAIQNIDDDEDNDVIIEEETIFSSGDREFLSAWNEATRKETTSSSSQTDAPIEPSVVINRGHKLTFPQLGAVLNRYDYVIIDVQPGNELQGRLVKRIVIKEDDDATTNLLELLSRKTVIDFEHNIRFHEAQSAMIPTKTQAITPPAKPSLPTCDVTRPQIRVAQLPLQAPEMIPITLLQLPPPPNCGQRMLHMMNGGNVSLNMQDTAASTSPSTANDSAVLPVATAQAWNNPHSTVPSGPSTVLPPSRRPRKKTSQKRTAASNMPVDAPLPPFCNFSTGIEQVRTNMRGLQSRQYEDPLHSTLAATYHYNPAQPYRKAPMSYPNNAHQYPEQYLAQNHHYLPLSQLQQMHDYYYPPNVNVQHFGNTQSDLPGSLRHSQAKYNNQHQAPITAINSYPLCNGLL